MGHGVLDVPRRSSPRTAVPSGAVALAGTYSAVYPRQSPGGWQLIGNTSAIMWDLDRENPALIKPGDRVRFKAVRERIEVPQGAEKAPELTVPEAGLVVVRPGLQCTVQDLGRPGLAALGVSSAGAMDRAALRRANRLAGNPADAAGLEVLYGGLALRAVRDQVLAVTGARTPLKITADGEGNPGAGRAPRSDEPFALLSGETLTLGAPTAGLRSYVAVRGGLEVAPVLGSRSTDTLSGIGPAPITAGTPLRVLPTKGSQIVGLPESPPPLPDDVAVLRVVPGPRQDWFTDEALQRFFADEWIVTPQSNRVGLRLSGPGLERRRDGELKSEGTVLGSVQVPPNGQPVLFLADHPVTGGYPVIGVVVDSDLDLAGQLPPGAHVRFAAVTSPSYAPLPHPQGILDA
jgi:biotin-dependent carboxylase-like uncharacterized protein